MRELAAPAPWRAGLSPEAELLLCSAHVDPGPARRDRMRALLRAGIDWASLLELADRHRLTPFVHWHLSRLCEPAMPPEIAQRLRRTFVETAANSLALTRELIDVLASFAAAGIDALPYKGPVLAQCVYGNVALRQMDDIDLLVRPADIERAAAVLRARGYDRASNLHAAALARRIDYQCRLEHGTRGTVIELHWTIAPRNVIPRMGIEELWPRRIRTMMLGDDIACPAHEDLLLALCVHGSKHRWNRLEMVCAVAELLRVKPIDWPVLLRRAEHWGAERMLAVGLILASQLLGAPLPVDVIARIADDRHAEPLVARVRDEMFAPPADDATESRRSRDFQLETQDGLSRKLRYLYYRRLIRTVRLAIRVVGRLQLRTSA